MGYSIGMETRTFVLYSDSSCDLTDELLAANDVRIVPFYVTFDGETFAKERTEIDLGSFYGKMTATPPVYPKTSLPPVQDYVDAFEPHVKAGMPVLCVCISSKFSSSFSAACLAKEQLEAAYPEAEIAVIDSCVDTILQGMLVLEIARMRAKGMGIREVAVRASAMRNYGRIFFTVGGLEYLKRGGRIGKVAALIGSVLKVKPMIVLKEGELHSAGVALTRKQSLEKIVKMTTNHFERTGEDPDEYEFFVGYGADEEEGKGVVERLKDAFAALGKRVGATLSRIGAAIAVHTGPYALGIGLLKRFEHVPV